MAYGKISDKQKEILEYIKSEILNRKNIPKEDVIACFVTPLS